MHAFTKADDLARWRVVRMLRTRHRWGWKDVRRRLTGPTGRWRPITAGGIELRKISKISVTRYRYRGNTIPSPLGTANT
jgi:RNA-directed DNA polymerase